MALCMLGAQFVQLALDVTNVRIPRGFLLLKAHRVGIVFGRRVLQDLLDAGNPVVKRFTVIL